MASHPREVLASDPDRKVFADSQRDGWYVAALGEPGGDHPSDTFLWRKVGGHWLHVSDAFSIPGVFQALGRDKSRAGRGITLAIGERVLTEAVFPGGWWIVVAAVDYEQPEESRMLYLPGPLRVDGGERRYPLTKP